MHGDTILRISAKGVPFVGRCEEHYGNEDGPKLAREYEKTVDTGISKYARDSSLRGSL